MNAVAGSIETDYLNGEIVMLGRLHGVPTPVNETLQRLASDMARQRIRPGAFSEVEVLSRIKTTEEKTAVI